MTYVMSDIHGCYDQYLQLLEEIEFSDDDVLYVLGDIIDRGDKSVELLRDMSMRVNVIPIMGNHEYMAVDILKALLVEITEENHDNHVDEYLLYNINTWKFNGGDSTLLQFYKLGREERTYLIEYLEDFLLYDVVTVNGQDYVLTHAGIPRELTKDNFDGFSAYEFLNTRVDYNKVYFKDAILVTGHTPTFFIGEEYRSKVYRENNHLAIDTGGVFSETFCCVCLDTGEEFYV